MARDLGKVDDDEVMGFGSVRVATSLEYALTALVIDGLATEGKNAELEHYYPIVITCPCIDGVASKIFCVELDTKEGVSLMKAVGSLVASATVRDTCAFRCPSCKRWTVIEANGSCRRLDAGESPL